MTMASASLSAIAEYPPPINDEEREALTQAIKDWSLANGLAVRPPPAVLSPEADPAGITAINVPVTLFPSAFPEKCFLQAKSVQKTYNELYARLSLNVDFLAQVVKESVTKSPVTSQLVR